MELNYKDHHEFFFVILLMRCTHGNNSCYLTSTTSNPWKSSIL